MAMQTGVAASKVLILVGAGVTGSVILRSGHLSELISHLQELIARINEAETAPGKYDAALLAAQVRQLAKEIKELSLSNPVTIFNGNTSSSDILSRSTELSAEIMLKVTFIKCRVCRPQEFSAACSFMLFYTAETLTSLIDISYNGYLDQGWSFSDMMYVTKHNMANAVASVSKQLDNVTDTLASTKRHLTKRLENLDWKVDEQREISKLIANDVSDVRSNLNQIGCDIGLIHEMVSGLEGKLDLLESKQDMTNSGLWYLCQVADNIKDGQTSKVIQDVGAKLIENKTIIPESERTKGLQFFIGTDESSVLQKTTSVVDGKDATDVAPGKVVHSTKTRIHRSYPVGLSFARDFVS
ncbi:hypothetical protein SASPL_140569 [Salvia splendens]|uniref:DUF1664 domain-containing protein n=1 Tax=Salvia splendens TaxID=180675 RepID=A0A8X8WR70_SALSN|nr:hypothetical protein SASPL_140569 [Salvia splendens]